MMDNQWQIIQTIPSVCKQTLHLFKLDLEDLDLHMHMDVLFPYLNDIEQKRMKRYLFEKDQLCFGIARAALKLIFSRQVKTRYQDIFLDIHEHGKPFIKNNSGLYFNISHSANVVLIGAGLDYELGVDTEINNETINHYELSESLFSPEEQSQLRNTEKERVVEGFYNCWTMKESFIKALGLGLRIPLDQFTVDLFDESPNGKLKSVGWDHNLTKNWTVQNFNIKDGYSAAYTCNRQMKYIQKHDFTFLFKKLIKQT